MRDGDVQYVARPPFGASAAASPLRFNASNPQFRRNPYSTYERLRREAPFFRTSGLLVITRYDDVEELLKSRQFSVGAIPRSIATAASRLQSPDMERVLEFVRGSVVFTDNPEHARLRRLIGQAYSTQALSQLEPIVDMEALSLLREADESGKVEFVSQVAERLPLNVLSAWMGIPITERAWIAKQVHVLRYLLDPGLIRPEQLEAARHALFELTDYFWHHVRRTCTDNHQPNLVTLLKGARSTDDRLSAAEVADACIMSFVAGNETTQCLLTNTIASLHLFPEQLSVLRANPSLVGKAVEESIRFETPLQMTTRLALEDAEISGHPVSAGDQILLCLASANRDERRFDRAADFDILRANGGHVGFGHGMHACLGGALSRLQTSRLLHAFLTGYRASVLDDEGEGCQTLNSLLRTWRHLHLRFHA